MKINELKEKICRYPGVAALNAMQTSMSEDAARTEGTTILLAPTGSGKTLAFSFPLLAGIKPQGRVQAMVLAPSRELVLQIGEVVRTLVAGDGLKVTVLYGGHSFKDEQQSLAVVPDVIVTTPGRMCDHIKRQSVDVSTARVLVIDEYDKMLELGFEDEMRRIVRRLTSLKRLVLTSATELAEMPKWLPQLGSLERIAAEGKPAENKIEIVEVESPVRDKIDTLVDLLRGMDNCKLIIFANHRDSAERICQRLKKEKFPVGIYHGGLDQPQREDAVELLANGTTPVLVATDLASRGLDIEAVDAIVHYHLPPSPEAWTHRNGRTARQDAKGVVYVIVSEADDVADYIRPDRKLLPSGKMSVNPLRAEKATLLLNLGRKEKISRGDILGYLIAKGGLEASEIGKISVRDHCALAAVPRQKAAGLAALLAPEKIKGKRVKINVAF